MIEDIIKENTAAVKALTAAVAALAASLKASAPAASPCPPAVYGPDSAAVEAAAVAEADATAEPLAAEVAELPVKPLPQLDPVPAAPAAQVMSMTEVRSLCARAGAAGFTTDIVNFLHAHGVAKLKDLDPSQLPELVALLGSKGIK